MILRPSPDGRAVTRASFGGSRATPCDDDGRGRRRAHTMIARRQGAAYARAQNEPARARNPGAWRIGGNARVVRRIHPPLPRLASSRRREPRSDTMGTRIEKDFLGEKRIPEDAYYGVQTLSYTHLRAHETDSYLVCRL